MTEMDTVSEASRKGLWAQIVPGYRIQDSSMDRGEFVVHSPGCRYFVPTLPFTSSLGDLGQRTLISM